MAINKRLLVKPPSTGITPSEHFGVVLYEGDGTSSRSINGGKFGAAFYGNGSSSRINLGNGKFAFDELSISVWVKPSGSGHRTILENYEYSGGSQGFIFRIDQTTGKARFVIYSGDCNNPYPDDTNCSNVTAAVSTNAIPTNAWTHIAVTMKIGELKMYINGSLDVSTVTQAIGYITSASTNIGVANHAYANGGESFYEGKIDQLRVFAKVLSSSEVSTLYAETVDTVTSLDPLSEDTTDTLQVLGDTSCIAAYQFENDETDLSGNYNGTGTEIQYAAGRYGQAASFNGSDSYISTTLDLKDLSSVSISFWAYWQSGIDGSVIGGDSSDGASGYKSNKNTVKLTYSSNRFDYISYGGDLYRHTTSLSDGWHHFAISDSGGTGNTSATMYVDGVSVSYSIIVDGGSYSNHENMQIGRSRKNDGTIGNYYDNKLDQIRIFNKVISASEVTTLYEENSLVASYRFEGNANDDMRAYDGTASNVTYEYGLGFTPDFVWLKNRSQNSYAQRIFDSTRGVLKVIKPSGAGAESTDAGSLTSFDTGGFTLGSDNYVNNSGDDFVAWCLKTNGGTTSSNSDGSVTSTTQVNSQAGFSICKWNGGVAEHSVGHNLGVKPEFVIIKESGASSNWNVYYDVVDGSLDYAHLNLTNAGANSSRTMWTSSVFYWSGTTTTDVIAYAFHSVDGFSKFGTYTGNADNNGPIVETGFEPAFVIIKRTSATDNWVMIDNKRSPINPRNKFVWANKSDAESTFAGTREVNFYSNGFQPVSDGSDDINDNNATYIYMAFAADPDIEAPIVAKSFSTNVFTDNQSNDSLSVDVGFKPGLIWTKYRGGSQQHYIYDNIRSKYDYLSSNDTYGNQTRTFGIEPTENGFTKFGNVWNRSGTDQIVVWAWKADDNEPTIFGGAAKAVYKFEDNANDVTGNNNGTASNVSYSSSGKFNKAADFSTSGANIAIGSVIPNTDTAVSVSAWVYLNSSGNTNDNGTVIGTGITSAGSEGPFRVNLRYVSANTYKITALRQVSGTYYLSADSNIIDSTVTHATWHHVVWTYSPTGRTLTTYLNGSKVQSTEMTTSGSSVNDSTSVIGNFRGNTTTNFNGKIDQVRIYNGVVSDIGVAELYAESTSQNDDLTLGGPPETIISANANAGFSVVKWEGTGSQTKIPHGLSAVPEMIISKRLDSTNNWSVYHKDLGLSHTTYPNWMYLNLISGVQNSSSSVNHPYYAAPSSTVIYQNTGSSESTNVDGGEYISYCFHSVSGFSKFGSYTGNGSAGQSITTGFQPDWVLIKTTVGNDNWRLYDTVRNRGLNQFMQPNNTDPQEEHVGNSNPHLTMTSTGFTITADGSSQGNNSNGNLYTYAAFKIN